MIWKKWADAILAWDTNVQMLLGNAPADKVLLQALARYALEGGVEGQETIAILEEKHQALMDNMRTTVFVLVRAGPSTEETANVLEERLGFWPKLARDSAKRIKRFAASGADPAVLSEPWDAGEEPVCG